MLALRIPSLSPSAGYSAPAYILWCLSCGKKHSAIDQGRRVHISKDPSVLLPKDWSATTSSILSMLEQFHTVFDPKKSDLGWTHKRIETCSILFIAICSNRRKKSSDHLQTVNYPIAKHCTVDKQTTIGILLHELDC